MSSRQTLLSRRPIVLRRTSSSGWISTRSTLRVRELIWFKSNFKASAHLFEVLANRVREE